MDDKVAWLMTRIEICPSYAAKGITCAPRAWKCEEKVLERYEAEGHRLYEVIDVQLRKYEYPAGAAYSVADIAAYPWVARFSLHGLGWRSVPDVTRRFDALSARPATARGMAVPL